MAASPIDVGRQGQHHGAMPNSPKTPDYIGRFAPSPTGELHFGSLVAAMASYLDARSHQGIWLVRMEDLDPPREQAGAAKAILDGLAMFGFVWDNDVVFQSSRLEAYQAVIDQLLAAGLAFWCGCSRRHLVKGAIYPGTCSTGIPEGRERRSVRLRVAGQIAFEDLLQGPQSQDLETEVGPFIIRRADGLTAYQLAVVVDDDWQRITHIVRGSDLLDSTPRQIFLQRQLGMATPSYAHIPIAVDQDGNKLSKQTFAQPVDPADPLPALYAAIRFLGHAPPRFPSASAFWAWAIANWRRDRVPVGLKLPYQPSH